MNSSSVTGDLTVSLRYLAVGEKSAVVRPSIGGGDSASEEGVYETRSVKMRSARRLETSLDREGFFLANQQTQVTDFFSETEIVSIYEKELQSLLTDITGAKRVEIFDHTRRASSIDTQRQHGIREPAATIHNDYDDASGPGVCATFFLKRPRHSRRIVLRLSMSGAQWRGPCPTFHSRCVTRLQLSTRIWSASPESQKIVSALSR